MHDSYKKMDIVQLANGETKLMYKCNSYGFIWIIFFKVRTHRICRVRSKCQIGAAVTGLNHSYSNIEFKLYLPPTPQLRATPDP